MASLSASGGTIRRSRAKPGVDDDRPMPHPDRGHEMCLSGASAAGEDQQVVREDRLANGRDEVFPAPVEASSESKHSFEKRDRALHARPERLRVTEQRIALSLGLLERATTLLGDGDDFDVLLERPDGLHVGVVSLVGRQLLRQMTEQVLVLSECRGDQRGLERLVVEHVVARDEFLLDLLDLDHVPELDGLAKLAAIRY